MMDMKCQWFKCRLRMEMDHNRMLDNGLYMFMMVNTFPYLYVNIS